MKSSKSTSFFQYIGLFALIYLIVFIKLDSFHLRWWDESMFAVNTYEMMNNSNYFSLYFNNEPDLFNTKPPLTSWIQIPFVKLLGYNELAVRLPSAIATAVVIMLVFSFVKKHFNVLMAWISALVLLVSNGFIGFHTARTGEADATLTLFVFCSLLFFIKFLIEGNQKHVGFFFLFLTLAFATKLFAALLFVPAMVFVLYKKGKTKEFILSRYFVFGILLFLFFNGMLVYLRESDTKGYLKELLFKDAGRLLVAVESHGEPFSFYIDSLFYKRFATWFALLIISISYHFWSRKNLITDKIQIILDTIIYCLISYLIIISLSTTKLEWYDMPLYPLMAVLVGYGIMKIITSLFSIDNVKTLHLVLVIMIIFVWPFSVAFRRSQGNTIANGEKKLEACEIYLHKKIKAKSNLNGLSILTSNYNGSLLFYKYVLREKKQDMRIKGDVDFNVGERVLISEDSLKLALNTKYQCKVIDRIDYATLYEVESIK